MRAYLCCLFPAGTGLKGMRAYRESMQGSKSMIWKGREGMFVAVSGFGPVFPLFFPSIWQEVPNKPSLAKSHLVSCRSGFSSRTACQTMYMDLCVCVCVCLFVESISDLQLHPKLIYILLSNIIIFLDTSRQFGFSTTKLTLKFEMS